MNFGHTPKKKYIFYKMKTVDLSRNIPIAGYSVTENVYYTNKCDERLYQINELID